MLAYTFMRDKWFEMIVGAFAVGVLVSSYLPLSFGVALFFLSVALGLLLLGVLSSLRNKILFLVVPLCLTAFVGGVARYQLTSQPSPILGQYADKQVIVEGVIASEPDARGTGTFLTVKLNSLSDSNKKIPLSDTVRVSADPYPEFNYGDRVRVSGKLQMPENFETDTGRIFDYQSYLAKDGIYYEIYLPKITLLESGSGNPVVSYLLTFKSAFLSAANQVIPEPESGLLAGLLLGEKHSLSEDLNEAFRRSGLVHIVVLSGYNLTIVAYAIMRFFGWFSRFLPLFAPPLAGALGIMTFTIMAGASATAVRAAIMALLVIFAKVLGRNYDIKRALFLAGFVMVSHNPRILAFDPSFQLSFLATVGLVYLSPFFEKWFRRLPQWFGMREIVAATFATQIFVLARLVDLSGVVSIVGVFANIIVLPFIPMTMLFGALAGFAAFLHPLIAAPFAYAAYALLHYQISVASFLGNLPLATVSVPAMPLWALGASYLVLALIMYRLYHKNGPKFSQPTLKQPGS